MLITGIELSCLSERERERERERETERDRDRDRDRERERLLKGNWKLETGYKRNLKKKKRKEEIKKRSKYLKRVPIYIFGP